MTARCFQNQQNTRGHRPHLQCRMVFGVVVSWSAMLHPASELRYVSDAIGYGVFATRFIPKGTITWVFDPLDQVISSDKAERIDPGLREALEKYSYVSGAGDRILCWDHSRFVNHSCNP